MTAALYLFCMLFVAAAADVQYSNTLWRRSHFLEDSTSFNFNVMLKQTNLDILESLFWNVSNPEHQDYGKHRTRAELDHLTRPKTETITKVQSWLRKTLPAPSEITLKNAVFMVKTNIGEASRLFKTPIAAWIHKLTGQVLHRATQEHFVPRHIVPHIDMIMGLYDLFDQYKLDTTFSKQTPLLSAPLSSYDTGYPSTWSNLRTAYNMPKQNVAVSQGIISYNGFYQLDPLSISLYKEGSISQPITNVGGQCNTNNGCISEESNLDMQIIMNLAANGTTYFINGPIQTYNLLETLEITLPEAPATPLVLSISYGSNENICPGYLLCNGETSATYRNRVDAELQRLGIQGTTVVVASGDSGPIVGALTCAPDYSVYCPIGGCQYNSSMCQQVLVSYTSGNVNYNFLFPSNDYGVDQSIIDQFISANAACNLAVDKPARSQTSAAFLYSTCSCSALTYRTYSGVRFSQATYSAASQFTVAYPASSAFVTSVGATKLTQTSSGVTETVASLENGASISTGGGFSAVTAQGPYQTNAVNAWVASSGTKPPSDFYTSSNRGIPDVAVSGHSYIILGSSNSDGSCPNGVCVSSYNDGTSASAPTFAAMISLMNDRRIKAGRAPVGFANYLLYQAYASNPAIYNDITQGNNRCGQQLCCSNGWYATAGWDPASGLGSPNFQLLNDYSFNVAANTTYTGADASPYAPLRTNTYANGGVAVVNVPFTAGSGSQSDNIPSNSAISVKLTILTFALLVLLL